MAMFDPKKAREENKNQGIPAGDYLLAIKKFERKTGKRSGKDFLHCMLVVIAGPAKKRTFFDNISLDLDNSGAMFRLSLLSESCGVEQAFDLEDDNAIRAALVMHPFKARVSRKVENGYVNNGIERYLVGDQVTDGDRKTMQEWVAEQAEESEWSGDDRDAPPPGDDDFAAGGHVSYRANADDDIPF